ncbi:hypothetical protein, partial [Zoogloea oryzae]|uniref:hypothetical protein n=1 Tax=Zoogloea oryzae TaxID=310767 RepID=UPI0024E18B8E
MRFQDFSSVASYNSALHKIVYQFVEKKLLTLIFWKRLSTFHASSVCLQQQYRERHFAKYSQLISCLLVAEKNNELLMKNHESHPSGSTPVPEAHSTNFQGRR